MTPDYEHLPRHEVLGLPHSWGLLDTNLGSLSLIPEDALLKATKGVTEGTAITLNLSLGDIDPPMFGRARWQHSVHAADRNTYEDVLDSYNPQASSQWDGFRHIRARQFGFYGGVDIDDGDTETLSIEHWARRGIAGRGVLLDVARWRAQQGRPLDPFSGETVEASELQEVARDQGIVVQVGDILCVRLGWVTAYRGLSSEQKGSADISSRFSGLRSDDRMAQYLWDSRVSVIATDNPAVESAPGNLQDGSLHRRMIPMLGVVFAELLDLDRLALHCAVHDRYDFLFVSVPLAVPGGVSSPANAMAIV
jgi:kynurenine formamidase